MNTAKQNEQANLIAAYKVGYNRGYHRGVFRPNVDLPTNYTAAQYAEYDKGFDNGNSDYWHDRNIIDSVFND